MIVDFIGRSAELAVLRSLLAEAAAGSPRVVEIVGPPGIGKTALVDQFLETTENIRLLRASCDESETLLPFGVLAQLHAVATPAMGVDQGHFSMDDPVTAGLRLLDLLGNSQRRGPVVMVLDDAQWADLPSLRAITFALRRLVADQALVLLVVRENASLTDGLRRLVSGSLGAVVRMSALSEEDMVELARAMGVELPSKMAAQRLRDETWGNPMHARAVLEEFPVTGWADPHRPMPPPSSLRHLILERHGACSPQTQRLVEAASVIGQQCALRLAVPLSRVTDPLPALDEAAEAGLLNLTDPAHPSTVQFQHPLIRAAIYGSLAPAERARLHTEAARLEPDPAAALRHRIAATPAGDAALEADLTAFAETEMAKGAWPSAAAHLVAASRVAVDVYAGHLLLLRAVSLMLISGDAAGAATYAAEIAQLPAGPLRDSVRGHLAIANDEPAVAQQLLETAWASYDSDTDPELAATIALQNAVHWHARLQGEQTVHWSDRALALAPAESPTAQVAQAHRIFGLTFSGVDGDESVLTHSAETVHQKGARGWRRLFSDDLAGAMADLESAAMVAAPLGIINSAAFAYAHLSRAEYLGGNWDKAIIHAERGIATNIESDSELIRGMIFGAAVQVPAARGEFEIATELARGAAFPTSRYERIVAAAAIAGAQIAIAKDDHSGVLEALDPVVRMELRDGIDQPALWPWAHLYAEALVAAGSVDRAHEFLRPHEGYARARGLRSPTARLARARGRIEAAAGRPASAEAAFQLGRTTIGRLNMPFEKALLEFAHGQFLHACGDTTSASVLLTSAFEVFSELSAIPYAQRCQEELLACGLTESTMAQRDRFRSTLTSQESVVARLVATGLSNREVAAELFISVKTVEFHVGNVYRKLGLTSRQQLRRLLREKKL